MIFFSLLNVVSAQTLSIQPASQDVYPGGTQVSIDIDISSVSGLYGFQFDIANNTNGVGYDSHSEGSFLDESGTVGTFCVTPDFSTSDLARNYACTRQQAATGVSGSGTLASFTLTSGLTLGPVTLTLQNTKLSDINSQPITHSANPGQIVVRFCTPPQTQACGSNVGECQEGTRSCVLYDWDPNCVGEVGPTAELCDGLDNNCNTETDEDWPELGNTCTGGGLGECASSGTIVCNTAQDGTECNAVPGTPSNETCIMNIGNTPEDEDCDGDDDEYIGDTDCSCEVDILDLSFIGTNFGNTGAPGIDGDLNLDGEVDIFDLVTVGSNFATQYTGENWNGYNYC